MSGPVITRRAAAGQAQSILAADIASAKTVPIEHELARRGHHLRRQGHELVGPCPRCGGRDRFAINVAKGIWNCRGCNVGGDIVQLVRHIDAVGFHEAIETITGTRAATISAPAPIVRVRDDGREQRQLRRAAAIWANSAPLPTEAIVYFAKRGIDINGVPNHGGLRFHPRCPFDGDLTPCIVARFTTAIGNEPRGIWRRPLDGCKPKGLGPMSGCVIRLWPDDAVTQGLVLGEGVETTLAAATRITHRNTLLRPAWSTGSAGNMRTFPILPGIDALTLLVDNDEPDLRGRRAGQEAAAECARRWSEAGREVIRLTPKVLGTDFNDLIKGGSK